MKSLVIVMLAACGSKPAPTGPATGSGSAQPAPDPRTPIVRRRDAACDALGPKLVACAVSDTKADLDAGKISKAQFDDLTAPVWLKRLEAKWFKECKVDEISSHQVRVLEVCFKEEQECGPLLDCLTHLHDHVGK
jgi:hypothetical protein